ncbi:MAG: 23S rRNA pseudouridine(1911/1915/1917) synthase RluD [Hahellaceae bacterium]|nr:23S rRNA pseudouridine(1911/1915/1917) synthase RluD [Hahellaceae bacterium]MCP5210647.1 23S rRNA pseudouridine(1911/1915/1917) synthase RluD [Hahellaceae bacterium]
MKEVVEADFVIPESLGEVRVDQAVAELMPEHSRSRIQGWIKSGALTVNGKAIRPKDKVVVFDVVNILAEIESSDRWEAENIPLDVAFQDEHIIVINKPAGLVVHPAAGHPGGTLVNALLHHFPEVDKIPRAGIVHRLDKDTSGLMVVARSLIAHTSLVSQLQDRSMGREYLAVVCGAMISGGKVDEPIARHPQNRLKMSVFPMGKPAVTHYRIEERFNDYTLVRCKLETGRTHQIRVHMAHIHFPLVGDPLYGGRLKLPSGADDRLLQMLRGFTRQALHATRLQLRHPKTAEELSWEAAVPEDMQVLIETIREENPKEI